MKVPDRRTAVAIGLLGRQQQYDTVAMGSLCDMPRNASKVRMECDERTAERAEL